MEMVNVFLAKWQAKRPSDVMTRMFEYAPVSFCICGAKLDTDHECVSKKVSYGIVTFLRCKSCGSYLQSPQVTVESLAAWYDSDDYQGGARQSGSAYINYEADEGARQLEARIRYQGDLKDFIKPGSRVLEVGCASGTLLSVLREAGHEVHGVDLSHRFAEMSKRLYGLEVAVGDFTGMDWPAGHFDAVILLGTISNLQNLPFALSRIRTMLKPNGILIFNFPHSGSLVARLYGDRFWMFAPSVSSFMSIAGCRDVLSKYGFHVKRIRHDVQQPSIGKLLRHAKLDAILSIFPQKWLKTSLSFAIPVPGVKFVLAQKSGR